MKKLLTLLFVAAAFFFVVPNAAHATVRVYGQMYYQKDDGTKIGINDAQIRYDRTRDGSDSTFYRTSQQATQYNGSWVLHTRVYEPDAGTCAWDPAGLVTVADPNGWYVFASSDTNYCQAFASASNNAQDVVLCSNEKDNFTVINPSSFPADVPTQGHFEPVVTGGTGKLGYSFQVQPDGSTLVHVTPTEGADNAATYVIDFRWIPDVTPTPVLPNCTPTPTTPVTQNSISLWIGADKVVNPSVTPKSYSVSGKIADEKGNNVYNPLKVSVIAHNTSGSDIKQYYAAFYKDAQNPNHVASNISEIKNILKGSDISHGFILAYDTGSSLCKTNYCYYVNDGSDQWKSIDVGGDINQVKNITDPNGLVFSFKGNEYNPSLKDTTTSLASWQVTFRENLTSQTFHTGAFADNGTTSQDQLPGDGNMQPVPGLSNSSFIASENTCTLPTPTP